MATAMSALVATTRAQLPSMRETAAAESVDLVTIAREIIGLEQLVAADHAIHLTCDDSRPLRGAWDIGQVQRMLANLINNAVKYSPPGTSVDVRVGYETSEETEWAVVSVSDRGIGIPAPDLPFIFEPFHRGSNVGTVNGTGLGLASVWQTVTAQQGRLWVDSEVGRGTTLTVRLPLG
jgi:signal transduction histidine kinase